MTDIPNFIYISKLDAAKRQLETAIRLFFNNSDFVSIHTLTCAGYDILKDLAKKQNITSQVQESFEKFIRADKRKEVLDKLNKPKHFFKHANIDDPESTVMFSPDRGSEFWIWDACSLYFKLTKEKPALMFTYEIWFTMMNRDIFMDSKLLEAVDTAAKEFNLTVDNRPGYWNVVKHYELMA